jgi:hypothetical protein
MIVGWFQKIVNIGRGILLFENCDKEFTHGVSYR